MGSKVYFDVIYQVIS